jgi:hypothetical protein
MAICVGGRIQRGPDQLLHARQPGLKIVEAVLV